MNTEALTTASDDRKRKSTLAAAMALRGYELHELSIGELLIARWGLAKTLYSVDELAEFARAAGALQ